MAKDKLIKDIKTADKLDKYRAHIIEDAELSESQTEKLKQYRAAFSYMCKNRSPRRAVSYIEDQFNLSIAQSYVVVREAIQLFGDVSKFSIEGEKNIMFENYMRAARIAEKKKDVDSMIRALHRASQVRGLYDSIEKGNKLYELFNIKFEFTTSPDAIGSNTIDITPNDEV